MPTVEIHGSDEHVGLSFAEEFETRVRNDPQRLWDTKEYVAKGKPGVVRGAEAHRRAEGRQAGAG